MDFWFTAFALVTTVFAAAGGALLLVGYFGTLPAALSFGWRIALPVVVLPVVGPIWFGLKHGPDFRRPALQLIIGSILLIVAGGLLLGYGPYFAEKLVAEMAEAARMR